MKSKKLKKDIVIPAGTVFQCCENMVLEAVRDTYTTSIGLTKDSDGEFVYSIDPDDPALDDWFEDIK